MATFTTLYGWGQEVWFINEHYQAEKGKISMVTVVVQDEPKQPGKAVQYVQYQVGTKSLGENRVFGSLQKLAEHVTGAQEQPDVARL